MTLGLKDSFHRALEGIRGNDGLTVDRVNRLASERGGSSRQQWRRIEDSDFARELTRVMNQPFAECIIAYIKAVAARLPEQKRLVVDLTLALRLEGTSVNYGGPLGQRRNEARRQLAARAARSPSFPVLPTSDTKYREDCETPSLEELAKLLDSPSVADFVAMDVDPERLKRFVSDVPVDQSGSPGRVVVLGGAVMDLNFQLYQLPEFGGSEQALNFKPFPGGKGLTQAVACARLGMDTSLISVIGDGKTDPYTAEIVRFLQAERVKTELIKQTPGEVAPVTAVLTMSRPIGAHFAIGWKNELNLPFGPKELHEPKIAAAIDDCEFFLTSFELPCATVAEGLALAKKAKATTIVTPAPPYATNLIDRGCYKHIDYMVANLWELEAFASLEHRDILGSDGLDALALPVAGGPSGLRNLLVVHDRQCHAYSRSPGTRTVPAKSAFAVPTWPTKDRESAGDRDAFCAMLAKQLHLIAGGNEHSLEHAVYWATASMAIAGGQISVPESMPTFDEVAELVGYGHVDIPD